MGLFAVSLIKTAVREEWRELISDDAEKREISLLNDMVLTVTLGQGFKRR